MSCYLNRHGLNRISWSLVPRFRSSTPAGSHHARGRLTTVSRCREQLFKMNDDPGVHQMQEEIDQGLGSHQTQALKLQNDARHAISVKVGVDRAPMTWSNALFHGAQSWADQLAASGKFEHSDTPHGENIFLLSPPGPDPLLAATRSWLQESSQYRGQPIDGNLEKYGHYTQIIWPSTTQMGLAVAKYHNSNSVVCVAHYEKRGNFLGVSAYTGK